jgi:hypothetical protein
MAEFRFKSTVDAMARKKRTEANRPAQINFRPSAELMRRLRFVSEALGIDLANLSRMIITECLSTYEERARRAKGDS